MRLSHIQPEKLTAGLKAATLSPEISLSEPAPAGALVRALRSLRQPPVAAPVRVVAAPLAARIGLPHGVTNAIVHVERLRTFNGRSSIAFCETRNYRVLGPVPDGDEGEYPADDTVQVTASDSCVVPENSYCDGTLRVSVNGSINVEVLSLKPCGAY